VAATRVGVKVPERELAAVPLERHDWHGEWNYIVLSRRIATRAIKLVVRRPPNRAATLTGTCLGTYR
jgi:hypothetical protein